MKDGHAGVQRTVPGHGSQVLPNSSIPITCDRVDCTNPPCLVYREAADRVIDNMPLMIWAESGHRVLHPDVQAEMESCLAVDLAHQDHVIVRAISEAEADHAREERAEFDAFSYLTQDEGNPWGSE